MSNPNVKFTKEVVRMLKEEAKGAFESSCAGVDCPECPFSIQFTKAKTGRETCHQECMKHFGGAILIGVTLRGREHREFLQATSKALLDYYNKGAMFKGGSSNEQNN